MKYKHQVFLAAFCCTVILLGTFAAFLLVDSSTDRYNPGQTQRMLLVSGWEEGTLSITLMGQAYEIYTAPPQEILPYLQKAEPFLPPYMRLTRMVTQQLKETDFRSLLNR